MLFHWISQSEDTDFDGVGNNVDTDDDNDLIADDDVYPEIPIGDNEDSDDGAPNECVEACADTGMEADPDDDNDGVDDTEYGR